METLAEKQKELQKRLSVISSPEYRALSSILINRNKLIEDLVTRMPTDALYKWASKLKDESFAKDTHIFDDNKRG